MTLKISQSDFDTIECEGQRTFPEECCGFILGKKDGDDRNVTKLLSADNMREDEARHNRFSISPQDYMKGDKAARAEGLDILGFYHSHPNAPARPSQFDLDHAWPWYSYVIVSIMDGEPKNMTSWIMDDDRSKFSEETINVVS